MTTSPHFTNPFATRWTKPGALDYIFPPGLSAQTLLGRLAERQGWGAIVGPHGVGKSTLLRTLATAIEAQGRRVVQVALRGGQRNLSPDDWRQVCAAAAAQLIVDGYEQLSWWNRLRLKWRCRRVGAGLLVTAHQPIGIPVLCRLQPSLATAEAVAMELLDQQPTARLVDAADIHDCFARSGQNLRETLFALYDLHQRRASGPSPRKRD